MSPARLAGTVERRASGRLDLARRLMFVLLLGCAAEAPELSDGGLGDASEQDASVSDADFPGRDGMVVGFDGGTCEVGLPCDPARGCPSFSCQASLTGALGSASDPIVGLGADSIPGGAPLFERGYCTSAPLNTGVEPPRCDPADPESCPACSRCVTLFESGGIPRRTCLRRCTPSTTGNGCPTGSTCLPGLDVCLDGCVSDDQCRISRRDSDGDGDIEAPAGTASMDRLTYDLSAGHRCDPVTERCRHEGTVGASAGRPCAWDGDCEADGRCLYEPRFEDDDGVPQRGYCTKLGCNQPGLECAGAGKCQRRGVGQWSCLAPCEVGAHSKPAAPESLFLPHRDCRAGYACTWDGEQGAGVSTNGGCLPGNYNAIRSPNIGASCVSNAECYSPLGLGRCGRTVLGDVRDSCYVEDCGAPFPAENPDLCGGQATCVQFASSGATVCRPTCGTANDCAEGEACWNPTGVLPIASAAAVCLPVCFGPDPGTADAQCRGNERCVGGFVAGSTPGRCGEDLSRD